MTHIIKFIDYVSREGIRTYGQLMQNPRSVAVMVSCRYIQSLISHAMPTNVSIPVVQPPVVKIEHKGL